MELNPQLGYPPAYANQSIEANNKPQAREVKGGNEASVDAEQRLKLWLQTGDLETALVNLDVKQQRDMAWSWYRNDTLSLNSNQRQQVEHFIIGDRPERWTEMFKHSTSATAQVDGQLLRQELRASADFGKQQEALALKVLARVNDLPDSQGIQQLLRNELKLLIPRNGMLDNMMRNTHKPDLE